MCLFLSETPFSFVYIGSGQIWLHSVNCSGSEPSLDYCEFIWDGDEVCNHTADVQINCYGGEPSQAGSTPDECIRSELLETLSLARQELREEHDARNRNLTELRVNLATEQTVRAQNFQSLSRQVNRVNTALGSVRQTADNAQTRTAQLQRQVAGECRDEHISFNC